MALILVVLALVVIGISHWLLTPMMADLRAQMSAQGDAPELVARFGSLHSLSVILFGIQWLLATSALIRHGLSLAARRL